MSIIEDAAGVKLREIIPRVIPVTTPAVGTEWSVNVTAGCMWYVESISATLLTSATVANRHAQLTLSDGSTIFARIGSLAAHAAGVTVPYSWLRAFAATAFSAGSLFFTQGFPGIPLFGGFQIASSTLSLQVGDQWSAIALYVLEVAERPYDVELEMDIARLRGRTSNAYPDIPLGS